MAVARGLRGLPLPVADEGRPQKWQKPITLQSNTPKQIKQLFSFVGGLKIRLYSFDLSPWITAVLNCFGLKNF